VGGSLAMIATLAVLAANLLPLALDGETVTEGGGDGTAIAVVSAVSLVLGYVVLFALWRYVFSSKAKAKRGEPPEH
jgi:hypothetical protein